MKAIKELLKRNFCRIGLHRWFNWQDLDIGERGIQFRYCVWCDFVDQRMIQKYSILEVLMEFARRKG